MTTPQPQPAGFYGPRPITLVRVLYFIAFACALIAALIFGDVISGYGLDAALAWLAGGFASAWLAVAV